VNKQIYFPAEKQSVYQFYKDLAKFSGTTISQEIVRALEIAMYLEENPKVYLQKDLVPDFLEFLKHFGCQNFTEGTPPRPNIKFFFKDALVVGYEVSSELWEFICTFDAKKKEFSEIMTTFLQALPEEPLTSEEQQE
jgi:hypothetical protein